MEKGQICDLTLRCNEKIWILESRDWKEKPNKIWDSDEEQESLERWSEFRMWSQWSIRSGTGMSANSVARSVFCESEWWFREPPPLIQSKWISLLPLKREEHSQMRESGEKR